MATKEDRIIDDISTIRRQNNELWMDILKLAFRNSPQSAKKIFQEITSNDKKINKLSKELCK